MPYVPSLVLWRNQIACLTTSFGARQCIQISPNWGKGYARKGAALHGAHKWDDAIAAYEQGIKAEDSPALQKGLQEVKAARGASRFACVPCLKFQMAKIPAADSEAADPTGMGKMFQDPSLFAKLAANPKTAPLLADPSFMQKVCSVGLPSSAVGLNQMTATRFE
jgi:stress-induced-phosphoprotein 1